MKKLYSFTENCMCSAGIAAYETLDGNDVKDNIKEKKRKIVKKHKRFQIKSPLK